MAQSALPEDFDQRFDQSFGMVAFVANRFLVAQMRRSMVELDIDLETAFIYGTLGMFNVAAELPPGTNPAQVLNADGLLPRQSMRPARLCDLSQVSGLPRETVRRKLNHLLTRGWVERTEEGLWYVAPTHAESILRPFTRETVIGLAKAFQDVRRVLDAVRT